MFNDLIFFLLLLKTDAFNLRSNANSTRIIRQVSLTVPHLEKCEKYSSFAVDTSTIFWKGACIMNEQGSSPNGDAICRRNGFPGLYAITEKTELDAFKNFLLSSPSDQIFGENFFIAGRFISNIWMANDQYELYSQAVPPMPWNGDCLIATVNANIFNIYSHDCLNQLRIICEFWALPGPIIPPTVPPTEVPPMPSTNPPTEVPMTMPPTNAQTESPTLPPTPLPLPPAPPATGSAASNTAIAEVIGSTNQVYLGAYESRKNLRKSLNYLINANLALESISNKIEPQIYRVIGARR